MGDDPPVLEPPVRAGTRSTRMRAAARGTRLWGSRRVVNHLKDPASGWVVVDRWLPCGPAAASVGAYTSRAARRRW